MANEKTKIVHLAIGRLFRLMSSPEQPSAVEQYEMCRKIILDNTEERPDYTPNWCRDRTKGSAGD